MKNNYEKPVKLKGSDGSIEKWKREILETEKAFSQLASDSGLRKAFITYAADDAVIMCDIIPSI